MRNRDKVDKRNSKQLGPSVKSKRRPEQSESHLENTTEELDGRLEGSSWPLVQEPFEHRDELSMNKKHKKKKKYSSEVDNLKLDDVPEVFSKDGEVPETLLSPGDEENPSEKEKAKRKHSRCYGDDLTVNKKSKKNKKNSAELGNSIDSDHQNVSEDIPKGEDNEEPSSHGDEDVATRTRSSKKKHSTKSENLILSEVLDVSDAQLQLEECLEMGESINKKAKKNRTRSSKIDSDHLNHSDFIPKQENEIGESSSRGEEEATGKTRRKRKHSTKMETSVDSEVLDVSEPKPTVEEKIANGDGVMANAEVSRKKEKRKRKHPSDTDCLNNSVKSEFSPKEEDVIEEPGIREDEVTEKLGKKKRVNWKAEISESREPEETAEVSNIVMKNSGHDTAKTGLLSLLAEVDAIPNEKKPSLRSQIDIVELRKQKKRDARKKTKAYQKILKAQQKELEKFRHERIASIADLNVQNRKFKEKISKFVDTLEDVNAKRPRLNEGTNRKRLRSITPDREIISGLKWKDLTDEQREKFDHLREKRRLDKLSFPKITLVNNANNSSLRLDDEDRIPLTLADVQHFMIYSLHAHHSTGNIPSWVSLKNHNKISKVVCLVLDGVSMSDYIAHEKELPALKSFNLQLEVITPYAYGGNFIEELWTVPLTASQRRKLVQKYGSVKEAHLLGEALFSVKKMYPPSAFRVKKKIDPAKFQNANAGAKAVARNNNDTFPRTELLLRSWDLLRERIPVPFASGFLAKKYEGFVHTKDVYDEVTDNSPIWALDCEMCETKKGSELTRISVINEDFEVVYESLVKPYNNIVNYLTQYSGITPGDLKEVWTRLEDVQQDLRQLLPADVILAGHSIGSDLTAMQMFHPYVIDTSVCFNLNGIKYRKSKLKTLMAELLYERIQEGGAAGHDSVEDAASCLKLVKEKLARSIVWGDAVLGPKRSEQDSVIAQQQLLLRGKNHKPTVYPVAANSIIRSGPRRHQTVERNPEVSSTARTSSQAVIASFAKSPFDFKNESNSENDSTTFTKSLFIHLVHRREKNMLVVGDEEFISSGKGFVGSKPLVDNCESRIQFSVMERNDVLPHGCEKAPSNGITILRLPPPDKDDMQTSIQEIDTSMAQVLKTFREPVLFMVMLPGKNSPDESDATDNRGILMMKIIRPSYVPLTIEDIS